MMKSLFLSIPVGLGSVLTNQSWKEVWMVLHKTKRSFPLQMQAGLFSIWQDKVFNLFIMCFQWSIPWSLSLSHAVLAQWLHVQSDNNKTRIRLLICWFCLALLLFTFVGVCRVLKNMTCYGSAGSIVLVHFVGYQQFRDGETLQWGVCYKSNWRQWTSEFLMCTKWSSLL